ncbi:Glucuronoyl esterase catalytic domain from Hypocrea Jecorina [Bisporella sp. PMI_857]|nr:Glucuronoyl esterase catalytic domain from Hypocrea Jecorina [Bisporella sp. PMI_857]
MASYLATALLLALTATAAPAPNPVEVPRAAAACTALPSSLTFPTNTKLPDPLKFYGGTRVATKADYDCRRAELSELIQRYELGTYPGPPDTLTASLSGKTLTINVGANGKSISFSVSITTPTSGTAPYPAILGYGGGSLPVPAGVASINFNNDDIAAQQGSGSRGQGKFYTLFGSSHSAGALTAWAWGVARVIDALEKTPSANIDPTRIGVTGCSRNGKGAIVAGAFDSRIALTLPQESGAGGSACWRVSDAIKAAGGNVQTAAQIITENPWTGRPFDAWVSKITQTPHDHHFLAGMIAPRGLFIIDNNIDWLGPQASWVCAKAGHKIYEALGVPDNLGYSQIGSHAHCAFPSNQQAALTAFINKFLLKQTTANTAVMQADTTYDEARWVDWTVPTLT